MKKVTALLVIVVIAFLSVAVAIADELNCRADGDDVLVPDEVVRAAIMDFNPNRSVYAVCDANATQINQIGGRTPCFVFKVTRMVQEEDGSWRALDMRYARFTPAQFKEHRKDFFENCTIDCWGLHHFFLPASWFKIKEKGVTVIYLK